MTIQVLKKSLSYLIAIIFVFLFAGSGFADSSNSVKIAKDDEREYAQKRERYESPNGPPAHTPAQGYRAKFKYHYYPRCNVYYDAARGIYFYLKAGIWEAGMSLPSHLQRDLGEYVSLELDTDKPFLYNEEHSKKYSSKQINSDKRQTGFFKKLWVLLFAR